LFGFKEVSEYFSSKLYKYVIGIVNLETLYALREQLRGMDVFIVNTGRKGINPDRSEEKGRNPLTAKSAKN